MRSVWPGQLIAALTRHKLPAVAAVTACYILVFLSLHRQLGPAAGALVAVPMLTAAWLLGMRAGLLAAILTVPLNTLLLNLAGMAGWAIFFSRGGTPGLIALIVTGTAVGRLHDLGTDLRTEIRARIRAEEVLRASEARFHTLIDHAPVAVCVTDTCGTFVLVNRAFCELSGYGVEEAIGRPFTLIVPPEQHAEATALYAGGFVSQAPNTSTTREAQVRTADGRILDVLLASSYLPDASGQLIRASFLLDITARAVAERATEEARSAAEALARMRHDQAEEAEAMAEVSTLLVSSLEPATLYHTILQQAARVLPFDHAEILLYQDGWEVVAACLGEPCVSPQTRLVPVNTADPMWQAMARGHTQHLDDTEDVPTWRDCPPWVGPYRIRSAIIVPLLIDGALLGVFEVFCYRPRFYTAQHVRVATSFGERATQAVRNAQLYTAEQQRARAAEELARLRSDFVAAVSHELRTPLTAIVGYAELLQAHWYEFSEERRLERIGQIVASANRQKRLVEDLLLINRMEGEGLAPHCEPLQIVDLVHQAASEVQGSYTEQRVILEGPADLRVLADPAHTLQVLANLLDNAAKYSPEGSPIVVCWGREGGSAVVRVVDYGPGLPEEGREQLFARFGRLPGSRIRAGRVGTGLGLYLSRGLAEAMGGDLDLEATGPAGSTFRLRLPAAPEGANPPTREPAAHYSALP